MDPTPFSQRTWIVAAAMVTAAACAGCPSRPGKRADEAGHTAPLPGEASRPTPPPAVGGAPARTETDGSPAVVATPDRPKRVGDLLVFPCALTGFEDASLTLSRDRLLTLVSGGRTISTIRLTDDLFGDDVEMSCTKRSVVLHLEREGRLTETVVHLSEGRLIAGTRRHGDVPPPRGP